MHFLKEKKTRAKVYICGGVDIYHYFINKGIVDVCILSHLHKSYDCDRTIKFVEQSLQDNFTLIMLL